MIRSFAAGLAGVVSCSILPANADGGGGWRTLTGERPLVIGHRGASGGMPEHTLESYRLAIRLGADFIEPDLVSTSDGVLVVRHEPNIAHTTDVDTRPEFAARRTSKTIDGRPETGWFVEDFTLAELKTLRAVQANPRRDQSLNGRFEIPTLQEVIDLAVSQGAAAGRAIGIYPETKHPSYFRSIGLPLEEKLVAALRAAGLDRRDAPVFIQSFEVANLQRLAKMTQVRLVQLIAPWRTAPGIPLQYPAPYDLAAAGDARTYADLITPAGLAYVARYAAAIGPWKHSIVIPREVNGRYEIDRVASLVRDAHAAGLLVHPYTFQDDSARLLADYGGDPIEEYRHYYTLGVDGVFSDFPASAVSARVR